MFCAKSYSQKNIYFDSYSIEDGFSGSKANVIIQDRKGFIWVGTWNGLTRFDGYECEIYTSGINNPNGLSNKEVVSLLEDHDGNIWIGTSDGLNKLNPVTGKIEVFDFGSRIISLYEDSQFNIWVGTWSNGLFMFKPKSGQRISYLPNDVISDILEVHRNEFWVATYRGLVKLNAESKSFKRYLPDAVNPSRSVPHHVITQLETSDQGDLWIGTWGGGVCKMIAHFDMDSIRFQHYQADEREGSISSNDVYRLFYDQFGDLWIGTWNAGISLLERSEQNQPPSSARFVNFRSDASDPYAISDNNITALYVDRSGVLWVGSAKINKASVVKNGMSFYSTLGTGTTNSELSIVKAFSSTSENQLWVGCSDGLTSFNYEGDQYLGDRKITNLEYRFNGYLFKSNLVLSLCSTQSGLWVGTDDAGLLFYSNDALAKEKPNSFQFFNSQTSPKISGNKVNCLHPSKKFPDIVWLGTMQNGFSMVRMADGKVVSIENYLAAETELADNNIRDILEDRRGIVWIATQKGLSRFDPIKKEFQSFYASKEENSINDNVVNCLHEDDKGNLWIGTNTGLNKLLEEIKPDGERFISFKRFPDINNLSSSLVMNILEGDSSQLLIGFYDVLVRFDYSREEIVDEYYMKEYLHLGIERNSAFRDARGKLLLGGRHGFVVFDEDDLNSHSRPPEIRITDLLVFNKSINDVMKMGHQDMQINSITYSDTLVLSYKDRVFTFAFSAMDYKSPDKNSYSYILEGFDKAWNDVGGRNTATYTNVPPGRYLLKVKAKNSLGAESPNPATLNVIITPPLWLTPWAYVIYALVLVGLLYFFNQYSIIKAQVKSRLLLAKVHHEKDREVYQHKMNFFTNITHEFRTPLTLILGPSEELLQNADLSSQTRKSIERIKRNTEKLLRLVNQLMEFRKVEEGKMELSLQKVNVVNILTEMHETFRSMARSRKINFSVEFDPSEIFAWIDRDKIEKVLYNLLSNAFKYSDDRAEISLKAGILERKEERTNSFFVEVKDNGIGISVDQQDRIFESFYQIPKKGTQTTGGIGLYLSKIFVEQHGGTIEVDSEPGVGSCFRIFIPMDLTKTESRGLGTNTSVDNEAAFILPVKKEDVDAVEVKNQDRESIHSNEPTTEVLLVEDDIDMSNFIKEGLSEHFNISTAMNGKEAFDLARKNAPDIIISDVMMPGMDGFELARLLRSDLETSHIPLIFLTAKTLREDELEGLRLGAVDYIYKPFNMASLRLKVINIIKTRGENREKFMASRLLEPEKITLSSLDEEFLKKAVKVIDENVDDPDLDVEKLSEKLSLTPNQTYRKIKALTGFTAKEFIRVQRLKIAASLLAQNKRSISEIIYMVGFSSPSYFSRCFKEQYNCTPSEYVKLFENKKIKE
ncbi:two-component regulator propeller domain-containing protein [Thermophagus sp. OGC60D27]|uniref:two-component regulator propeller domain-containing protein n=1 Tax=Thermophagus sp. OGC60D27 TaxID=3458415 RepID=UPI004037CC4F